MRALLCTRHGDPELLELSEVPLPQPGPGQVRIAVQAAGVNFPDTLIIRNLYQFKPALPFSPGGEVAGVITALGDGVVRDPGAHGEAGPSSLHEGDRVMALCGHGGFAEQVVVDEAKAVRIPEGVSMELAASFTMVYATSYHALVDRAALKSGENLLVLGAAGGVGLSAVEIGKALGARVIAAASSDAKLQVCREHGADDLINYTREDLRERLRSLTGGQGVDVVYDPVGGHFTERAFRSIAWRGRYLVVGFALGEIPSLPLNLALLKGAGILGVFWGAYISREPQAFQADMQRLLAWVAQGRLRPRVSARYSLEEAPQAIRALMDRRAVGKLVVVP
jgi:NADPH2:quinone reductase